MGSISWGKNGSWSVLSTSANACDWSRPNTNSIFSQHAARIWFFYQQQLELDEVLDRILENLSRIAGYTAASIMLVNDERIASIARTRGYTENGI